MATSSHKVLGINGPSGIPPSIRHLQQRSAILRIQIGRRTPEARTRIVFERPEIILLDGDSHDREGIDFLKDIRPAYPGPIVFLSSSQDESLQIEALEAGADGFLPKHTPWRLVEARIAAILRRSYPQPTQVSSGFYELDAASVGPRKIETGALVIDRSTRCVSLDGASVHLSSREFNLLWILAKNTGQVVARGHLFMILSGKPWDGLDRGVDVLVARLRKRIGDDARHPTYIKSVHGVGYQLAQIESDREFRSGRCEPTFVVPGFR